MCERTAQLAGLADRKGQLKVGMDGDLVIWDPEAEFQVGQLEGQLTSGSS